MVGKNDTENYFSNGLFPFLHFNVFPPVLEDEYTVYAPLQGDGRKNAHFTSLNDKVMGQF